MDVDSTKETTDAADLVSRIRAGDQEAKDELVRRYSRGVFVIVNKMVRNPPDAEELVQETFIVTLEKIKRGELREPDRLSGFVCGIARTLAQVHVRKSQSRNLTEIDEARPPIDPNRSPLEQLLRKEEAEIVRQVIGELRMERDRELLTHFYLLGEDKETICANLDLTGAHFNRVIFRALARFKELYEQTPGSKKTRR